MDSAQIRKLLEDDAALFHARYYRDAHQAASYISEKYAPVTQEEVGEVLYRMAIHPSTGAVM